MELNEYQKKAIGTCMPTCDNFSYMMLNLVGEIGEIAGKIAKGIRKGMVSIDCNQFCTNANPETDELITDLKKRSRRRALAVIRFMRYNGLETRRHCTNKS